MQAYFLDLRQGVLDACQRGQSERDVAARFALSNVQRYKRTLRTLRTTSGLTPKPWPGRAPKIRREQEDDLRALVAEIDWTLASLCHAWKEATGVEVARDAMGRTLARFGVTQKK
jgi:transposase